MTTSPAASPDPEVYEATCAMDGSDAVDKGTQLTRSQAEARRRTGLDIVVCGPDPFANSRFARAIESAVTLSTGRCIFHSPHLGPLSLPHWQQNTPPPIGHSFFE